GLPGYFWVHTYTAFHVSIGGQMHDHSEYRHQRRRYPGVVVPAVERQQRGEDNLLAETVTASLGLAADCFGAGGGMAAPALFCLEGGPWSACESDGVSRWRPSVSWRVALASSNSRRHLPLTRSPSL